MIDKIPDTDWKYFETFKRDKAWNDHECDERCIPGFFKNPIAIPSKICKCGDEFGEHWKGKKCRVYGCCCMKFEADESV